MFLIFSNDLPSEEAGKKTILFVDDTSDLIKEHNLLNMRHRLQQEANKSVDWMTTNKMIISESKTKLMLSCTNALRRTQDIGTLEVTIKGMRVKESKSEKILGITVSNDLTWKHHFYGEPEKLKEERNIGLLADLSRRIGVFRRVARYDKGSMLRSLAAGLFYSK